MKKLFLVIALALGIGVTNTHAKDIFVLGDLVYEVRGNTVYLSCAPSQTPCIRISDVGDVTLVCKVDLYQNDAIVDSFYADENYSMQQEGENTVFNFEIVDK